MMEIEEDKHSDIEHLKSVVFNAQNEVKSNTSNYDSHIKLISSLSKLYDIYKADEIKVLDDDEKKAAEEKTLIALNKLRNARKSMAAIFPLSNDLWINWINDELNASPKFVDHVCIEEIFSKAVLDYLSVDIWCLYVNYLINRQDCGKISETYIREILEKAVLSCGLHYQDGHKIWEAYQKFEEKLFLESQERLKTNSNPQNLDDCKGHLLNLIKIFKRQMRVPLANHDELLTRFLDTIDPHLESLKLFTSEVQLYNIEEIKNIHADTLSKISKSIAVQEINLVDCQHSLEAYQSYINNELDSGFSDPARIQCNFERAIVYHCLRPSIWFDYINFLNDVLKQTDLALTTCRRALRNVTWDPFIYVKYAIILEQNCSDVDEIRNTYEMGLDKYSDNGFNYYNVWVSYISFEKRLSDTKGPIIKKKQRIYDLIQKAVSQFDGLAEPDKFIIEFMIFWINIEKYWFEDDTKCEIILKYFGIKYRRDYNLWYQIVTFAKVIGYKNLVNDLYNIGLGEFPDSFEQVGYSWLNFQDIFGTIDSRNNLEKKINIHVPYRIQSRKSKESLSIKSKVEHQNKFLLGWLNRAGKELFTREPLNSSHPPSEKASNKSVSPLKNKTAFGSMKHGGGDEEMDIEVNRKDSLKRTHEDSTKSENSAPCIGPIMPPGFIQASNDNSNDSEDSDDSDDLDAQLMPPPKKLKFLEKSLQSKTNQNKEPDDNEHKRTVYVSNLHPATSESDLKIIFGRAGNVEKVDLHKQRGGKIFAFVTFSKLEEAENAYELEHTPIRNRPVFVSKFSRSKDKNVVVSNYSQQEERNKLYVSNLDKSTTPNDLEKLFNRHGDMTSLRLINKKGSTKPFAFVEYKNEDDASRYRDEFNHALVRGREIMVEFSNPGRAGEKPRQFSVGFSSYPNETKVQDKKASKVNSEDNKTRPTEKKDEKSSSESNTNKTNNKMSSTLFGFIPLQARNPRNQQPTSSKPKGPAVRIDVASLSNPSKDETSKNQLPPDEKDSSTVSSVPKSNEDFRNMLLKK